MRILCLIPEAAEILAAIGDGCEVRTVLEPGQAGLAISHANLQACPPALIFTSVTRSAGLFTRRIVRRAVARVTPRPHVYALEPHTLGDILSDVKTVGDAIGRQREARSLIEALRARIDAVSLAAAQAVAERGARRVACLLTDDPPLAAGWWQAEMVGLAGGLDVLDGVGRPPRPTSWPEIERAEPEMVVLLDAGGASVRGGRVGNPPLTPGPGVVSVLERLAVLLHPPAS
jgi:iron complex transport system substrate-binding protein